MTVRVTGSLAAIVISLLPIVASGQHVSFFPKRPPKASLRTSTGIIRAYGVGTGRGDLTIATPRREMSFALSLPYRIDGRPIACHRAPRANDRPPKTICADWPAGVVLGRSTIVVTYWTSIEDGRPVLVSDAFETVTRAPRTTRKR